MLPAYLFRITFSLENPLYWNFTEGTSKLFNDYCRTNKAALMVNFYWTKGEVVWLVNFVPNSTSLYLVDPSNTNRLSTRNDQYSTNAFSSFSVKKETCPRKARGTIGSMEPFWGPVWHVRHHTVVSNALPDRESVARLLPKSHGLLLNPKNILPGMGEKLAPLWFGGGSPLNGAPQLLPCAGAYPSWKELGMFNHLPGLSGPVERVLLSSRDPICQVSTCRALQCGFGR